MVKKIRKIGLIILILIICFNYISTANNRNETTDDLSEVELVENESVETVSNATEEPETYSKHIICIERTTGEVLFEKDAYTRTAMASTTKILTAIVTLENCNLNEMVEISEKAANTGGSTLGITAGTSIKMESLMYGLLLRSRK